MNVSRQEEIISALWVIAALMAFTGGFKVWGWIFAIHAGFSCLCSIRYAAIEIAAKKAKIA